MCFLDQMASLCWCRVPKSHISVLPNDCTFSWSPKPPKFFQLKKSYRTPKNSSENHGKSHQSFREDKGNEIIWVPLINNLRQPKKYLYKHIYKQEKKSHIPQMLSDSATSWGHRRRIKAFTAYRSIKKQRMKIHVKVVEIRVWNNTLHSVTYVSVLYNQLSYKKKTRLIEQQSRCQAARALFLPKLFLLFFSCNNSTLTGKRCCNS